MKRPRGTRDFLPGEMRKRRWAESVLRDTAERWGYGEVATPTFEEEELFVRRSGEAIVEELYSFEDKGGRRLALRPEFTAPVMRLFSQEMSRSAKPVKIYYFGNAFRYERPQSGRYREFWQFGTEIIGADTPEAAAESVALASTLVRKVGVEDAVLRVGHVGILRGMVSALGLSPGEEREVFRAVDKGDLETMERLCGGTDAGDVLVGLVGRDKMSMEDWRDIGGGLLDEKTVSYFSYLEDVLSLLPALGVRSWKLDPGIARGLDYYTGVVFEIDAPRLGAEKQVCGGGEYELGSLFGTSQVRGVGFALGFDRLLLASAVPEGVVQHGILDVFIAYIGEKGRLAAFEMATTLRENGYRVDIDLLGRNISKALKYASSRGARYVAILGEREVERGVATLRDMQSGEQREISLSSDELKNVLDMPR
ncbi:MAG: histidine--tRNA ligase [Thermoplasmata archaeon]|nr:histidine--tRNA ligase [Thermoplasmata archaeon]